MESEASFSKAQELENISMRLQEVEQEADMLREMKAEIKKEIGGAQDDGSAVAEAEAIQAEKEEADSRSIYVGNVDYACTPQEVQEHFHLCGTVNRVTIMADEYGHPKGFAYVEFVEAEAVQAAIALNGSELLGRPLKVCAKRTNIPGYSSARRANPYFGSWSPFTPEPTFFPPPCSAYGKLPRSRRARRFRPY